MACCITHKGYPMPVVSGLMVWFLLVGALLEGKTADRPPGQPAPLVLTNEHPAGDFMIAPEILVSRPSILALRVTKVVNPTQLGIHLLVYLSVELGSGRPSRVLLGDLGFYPSDRPAGFLLRSSKAFAELKAKGTSTNTARLSLELQRIHPSKPWTNVGITVDPPEWRKTSREAGPPLGLD